MLFVIAEAVHYVRHQHWVGYGWHLDVVSDRADFGPELWVSIRNLTLKPRSVKLCVLPNDISTPQVATSPLFDIEKLNEITGTWERAFPETRNECPVQTDSRTILPFASYDTREAPIAADGFKTMGHIRFVIYPAPELGKSLTPLFSSAFSVGEVRH